MFSVLMYSANFETIVQLCTVRHSVRFCFLFRPHNSPVHLILETRLLCYVAIVHRVLSSHGLPTE